MPGMAVVSDRTDEELDLSILVRCRERDPAALRAFVERYQRAVFALLSRMLGAVPEVEDLAQETFLRAFRALPSFDLHGAARPSTWLLTIATRLALDRFRRQSRDGALRHIGPQPAAPSPEHDLEQAELRHAIARAVEALPFDQRAAFVLSEFHALSIADIARALDASESTVKTRLFRARAKLSQALAHYRRGHDGS
jgi:RNA polymerase sigma-70 factor (ECF subfamily)